MEVVPLLLGATGLSGPRLLQAPRPQQRNQPLVVRLVLSSSCPPSPAPTFGSHSSHLGRYQFQSPRSFMLAGRSTYRMTVASMRTATPRPRPNCWRPMICPVAKAPKTATMMAAALVICPAVSLLIVAR